jgi:hypothetical protein
MIACRPPFQVQEDTVRDRLREFGFTDPTRDGKAITCHGFRRTLLTFLEEHGVKEERIRLACVAHVKGSNSDRSYDVGTALRERTKLMAAYGKFARTGKAARTLRY